MAAITKSKKQGLHSRAGHGAGRKPQYKESSVALGVAWDKRAWLNVSSRSQDDSRDRARNRISPDDQHKLRQAFAAGLSGRRAAEIIGIDKNTAYAWFKTFGQRPIIEKQPIEDAPKPLSANAVAKLGKIEQLKTAFARGMSIRLAAKTAGVAKQTAADWCERFQISRAKITKMLSRDGGLTSVSYSYPYFTSDKAEQADLLAICECVPHSYSEDMRADICQEMMLAIIEGTTTIDEIKLNREKSSWFFKKFYRENYEQAGRAISLTEQQNEDRNYDETASSIAAQDWHANQVYEDTKYINAMSAHFQPPTQIDDVWRQEVDLTRRYLLTLGQIYSFAETASLMENEGFRRPKADKGRTHAMDRALERHGLRLNRREVKEIGNRIDAGNARFVEEENDAIALYLVEYGGRRLPVIYNRIERFIITILEDGCRRLNGNRIKWHESPTVGD